MKSIDPSCRPAHLRRSWLFTAGDDATAQRTALDSGADVIVADLEEFTAPAARPSARPRIAALMARCRSVGIVAAVRINRLADDGLADLYGVMPGRPDAVFLPHVQSREEIVELARALDDREASLGLRPGSTEIVPTIESALGFVRVQDILAASARIRAALLAAEDLTADLNAKRGPDSVELNDLRSRFHVECTAAGRVAIDCPFNYRDPDALAADLAWAQRIGLHAKCTVYPNQVRAIHAALTPSDAQVREARDVVARFEAARRGADHAVAPVDAPDFNTARRRLARAAEYQAWADTLRSTPSQGEHS
ncbi:CoA ester lyase [Burkholderia multivorans]|uniref:HpcH/HpaI aldolase/citrate lyase family protein n=1 Tax=Burkholderia multivorans TaxID=87883 RepID=UPI0019D15C84|nr:aldolase/citrate lyase family protein [Burkholderia multivorans]QSL25730.1 CoA ester lyase [Burkholderia multivorans]